MAEAFNAVWKVIKESRKVRFGSTGHEYEVIEEGDPNCWCMTQHNKHRYSIIDEMTGVSIITTLEADCCGRILRREKKFKGRFA